MRLLLACALASAWLVLLLAGVALGGATHLLLAASVVFYVSAEPTPTDGGR